MKFTGFDLYQNSSTTFDRQDGVTFKVTAYFDHDVSPEDYDCYDAEQIADWKDNQWCYLILSVSVFVKGLELGKACLGAVESFSDDEFVSQTLSELADEAWEDAKTNFAKVESFFKKEVDKD